MRLRFMVAVLAVHLCKGDTHKFDATEARSFQVPLMGLKDQFYSTLVSIGTQRSEDYDQFALTLDMRFDGFVVADVGLEDGVQRAPFDWSGSATFDLNASYPAYLEGKDNATFLLPLSQPHATTEKRLVDVVRKHDASNDFLRPFFEQPYDGLFFYRTPEKLPYTIALQKTCNSDSTPVEAGSITYGNTYQVDTCGKFTTLQTSLACTVPILSVTRMSFNGVDYKYTWEAMVLTVPDIILPMGPQHTVCNEVVDDIFQEMFTFITSHLNVWSTDGQYFVNCNDKPFDPLKFVINDTVYALEYQYLVDKVGKDCVLRLKPSDTLGPAYCNRLCPSLHLCTFTDIFDFRVVLGLPFLHRYCVQYDENLAVASIATQKSLRTERCYYEPDPPTNDEDTSSSTTTTTTAVSRRTTTTLSSTSRTTKVNTPDSDRTTHGATTAHSTTASHSNGLPVMAIVAAGLGALTGAFVVGALVFYCRRRSQRRKRLVKALGSLVPRPTSGWTSNGDDEPYTAHADDELLIRPDDLVIFKDQQIGCGAFARVFLGELRRTGHKEQKVESKLSDNWTKVAVKQARLATEEARHDMHRELELMKDVGRHAHVVNLIGYVPLSSPLIILEYCEKGDLLTYLRAHLQTHKEAVASAKEELQMWAYANSSVTLKDLIALCWQISDGMTFLSSRGYVHRDLAARNILLTEDMAAKISDFGLCRFTNENLYVTQRGGKLPIRWMAPETLATANFSSASDVWSFGILLYEVFSAGNMPYVTLHPEDILPFLQDGKRLEQPQLCPADIYDLMTRCWHEAPSKRPTFEQVRAFFSLRLEYLSQGYGYLSLGDHNA